MAKNVRKEVRTSLFDGFGLSDSLEDLKCAWLDCEKCSKLAENRKQVVFWDGPQDARVMAVGQWPGRDEDKTGIPFQGKLGQLCRQMITSNGKIPNSDILWTNVLGCRIPDGSTFRVRYSDNCYDLLEQQIQITKPLIIIAMGRIAISRLCGQRTIKVEDLEGTERVYKGICTMFIKHPAFLSRIDNKREREKAREALGKQIAVIHKKYRELV